ncbi:glycoside hydrolase family 5 protein [Defluviicoccus vanus]|nr:glycoside hydrolase family 5 protein [Defluviicoccus vanus]
MILKGFRDFLAYKLARCLAKRSSGEAKRGNGAGHTGAYLLAALCVYLAANFQAVAAAQGFAKEDLPFLHGVNLASGSFGARRVPRRYGYDYIYAGPASVDYYQSKGFNLFRVAFLWESIQPVLNGPLSESELKQLDNLVNYATGNGLFIALDVHNYAKYAGGKLGTEVPIEALGDLWGRLAEHYNSNPRVLFDIMNEPNNMPTQIVKEMTQGAVNAIRAAGAQNVIVVEGNQWSGAWHWLSSGSDILVELQDPENNIVFSPHQYLDKDGSGVQPYCASDNIGLERIQSVTQWARASRVRLLLGEFGAGANSPCSEAVTSMLDFMHKNADVWAGWAWWAGGPWWGSYFSSIEPQGGADRPQLQWLTPFLFTR